MIAKRDHIITIQFCKKSSMFFCSLATVEISLDFRFSPFLVCVCVLPRKSAEWVSGRRLFHFWKRHQYSWWQVCRDKTTWHKAWNKKSTLPFSLRFNFCHFFWGGISNRTGSPCLLYFAILSFLTLVSYIITLRPPEYLVYLLSRRSGSRCQLLCHLL